MFCVFAKDPNRSKTRLIARVGAAGAAALARAFLADTLELVPEPRHVWADGNVPATVHAEQQGADLGCRMLTALSAELAAGAAGVVIVGSDAPTLPRTFLTYARSMLAEGTCDLVFGPAADGGYYLVGARPSGARKELFERMPWSSERVLRETLRRAYVAGLRTELLPWWYDVDAPEDLDLLCAHLGRLPAAVAPATRAALAALGLDIGAKSPPW